MRWKRSLQPDPTKWRPHFALKPVTTIEGHKVWLETVYRRKVPQEPHRTIQKEDFRAFMTLHCAGKTEFEHEYRLQQLETSGIVRVVKKAI